MPKPQRRLLLVVLAVHIAAYVAAAVFGNRLPSQSVLYVTFLALFLAQQSLLYIWAGLGTGDWRRRLATAYGVSVLLWALPGIVRGEPFALLLLVMAFNSAIVMAIFVTPFAVARAWGFRLQRFSRQNLPTATGFQISVRGMLIVTLVVACLLALGASIGDTSVMGGNEVTDETGEAIAFMLVCLPTLLVSSALVSVWATLSAGTVASRMVVGGLALATGGTFLPYSLNGDATTYAYWASLPPLTFLITSSTLLPFRSAGYRFLRATPS